MSTPEQEAALAADERSRQAHQHLLSVKRLFGHYSLSAEAAKESYDAAEAEAKRLWTLVGPDPLLSQINTAQAVTDAEEGHADGRG